ncbi:MAG: phosphatidylserine decarboxylase [Proteobacteria bacterium]|nr:phosphatidylserine decarboxylase [Pseudomonadota bacterium]
MNHDKTIAPQSPLADTPQPPRTRRSARDELNFLLTNRLPRHALTIGFGYLSRWRHPWFAKAAIALWRRCSDLDLSDAQPTRYDSLHACFTRALVPGARTVDADPAVMASPCDAIVGQCGAVDGTRAFQAKGYPYDIGELFGSADAAAPWRDGCYATLRLTASMYHRFHAPHDGAIEHVTYLGGDVWNVNPPALARVAKLYCRNERAVIRTRIGAARHPVALVPVAAILVASIRLHAIDTRLHLRHAGANEIDCDARFEKGDELGWFEHGSTIIVFAPRGFELAPGIAPGTRLRMGQALMRLPEA